MDLKFTQGNSESVKLYSDTTQGNNEDDESQIDTRQKSKYLYIICVPSLTIFASASSDLHRAGYSISLLRVEDNLNGLAI